MTPGGAPAEGGSAGRAPTPTPLPIDASLPRILAALAARGSVVVVAEAGAGKTTRVPAALLRAAALGTGDIVVVEPRRVAARLAAVRVAQELGEGLGERVGYEVRFERVAGPSTRLHFVTEGILARRLGGDPELRRVACLVFDEVHERRVLGDVALAIARSLQRGSRPELRLVAMSATVDARPLADFLGGDIVRVEGRLFDVSVEYAPPERGRPLAAEVRSALARAAAEGLSGDALVFLPGASEIRAAHAACQGLVVADGTRLELAVLHGDLSLAEQERVIRPAPRPRAIFATNVAESSLTIEGVTLVVDSGLVRRAGHSPWSGLPTLETRATSRASAAQRSGRAGRVRPGRCIRLYSESEQAARPLHDASEISRTDLTQTLLLLHGTGHPDARSFAWLEAPPPAALAAAEALLGRLGALEPDGRLSSLGRRLLSLPVHPRAGRLALEAAARGAGRAGCRLAALVAERELRLEARADLPGARHASRSGPAGASDLIARLDAYEAALALGRRRAPDVDLRVVDGVTRASRQLERALALPTPADRLSPEDEEQALLLATLAAFPDRVARRAQPHAPALVLCGAGGGAQLSPASVVAGAELLVAVEAEERRGRPSLVRLASTIEPDWLLELFPERVLDERDVRYDAARDRITAQARVVYDGLTLESREVAATEQEVEAALGEAALAAGAATFCDPEELEALRVRYELALGPRADPAALDAAKLDSALRLLCSGRRSFSDLRRASLLAELKASLDPGELRTLERSAPLSLLLRGGRRLKLHYERGKAPWASSRLQDFFGLEQGPRVAGTPVVLHLLAPNQRAVQITADLAGFWQRHYPSIRRELARRYPRHAWPEDPLSPT